MQELFDSKEHTFTVIWNDIPVKISFPGTFMTASGKAYDLCKLMGFKMQVPLHTEKYYVDVKGDRV